MRNLLCGWFFPLWQCSPGIFSFQHYLVISIFSIDKAIIQFSVIRLTYSFVIPFFLPINTELGFCWHPTCLQKLLAEGFVPRYLLLFLFFPARTAASDGLRRSGTPAAGQFRGHSCVGDLLLESSDLSGHRAGACSAWVWVIAPFHGKWCICEVACWRADVVLLKSQGVLGLWKI